MIKIKGEWIISQSKTLRKFMKIFIFTTKGNGEELRTGRTSTSKLCLFYFLITKLNSLIFLSYYPSIGNKVYFFQTITLKDEVCIAKIITSCNLTLKKQTNIMCFFLSIN